MKSKWTHCSGMPAPRLGNLRQCERSLSGAAGPEKGAL